MIKGGVKCPPVRDPTRSRTGKLRERDQSSIKQYQTIQSMEQFHCSLEKCVNGMDELFDSLEVQNDFSDHLKHLTQHKRNTSWLIDSLEQAKNDMCGNTVIKDMNSASPVIGPRSESEVRTASSLLLELLQNESLCACAVQLLTLLYQTCHSRYISHSACFGLPIKPTVLRMTLCHHDDGVRAAGCNLLTCHQPNWTLKPSMFTDLLSLLSDPAPTVRRSACKAVESWLGIMEKKFSSKASHQDLQREPGNKTAISTPAVTSVEERVRKVEGIRHGLKEAPGLPRNHEEDEDWLTVAMGAATPAVSLLADSDAVIRRHGCVILGNLVSIAGREKMPNCAEASNQLLQMTRTDSHHAVRRQAVTTLRAFSQQDALQQVRLRRPESIS